MTNLQVKHITQALKKAGTILLTTHRNPDGDGLGSGSALMEALFKMGKKVDFVTRDRVSEVYSYLPHYEKIRNKKEVKKHYDAVVFLECPDQERCGGIIDLKKYAKVSINIDHHLGNEMYADINVVDPKAAAVGMQLFDMFECASWKIDEKMAAGLYTAIITDTGSFAYSNTSPEVHMTAAKLLGYGAKPAAISSEVYSTTAQSTELLAMMLSKVKVEGKMAYSHITRAMIKKSGAQDSDTDNFINHIRAIRTIDIALLFKEFAPSVIKVSFRSKRGHDVNSIARLFDGGGHKYASGCVIRKPLKDAAAEVIKAVRKSLKAEHRKK
jgi:bifunctional oligoribonuclease and PAP phosphatase NrnA